MKWIDGAATFLLFALGCVHNFIAAPLSYDSLSTTLLWFVTGGISLWYASFINFLWLRNETSVWTRVIAFLTNSILVTFTILFMATKQSWTDPQNAILIGPAAWLMLRTVVRRIP